MLNTGRFPIQEYGLGLEGRVAFSPHPLTNDKIIMRGIRLSLLLIGCGFKRCQKQ